MFVCFLKPDLLSCLLVARYACSVYEGNKPASIRCSQLDNQRLRTSTFSTGWAAEPPSAFTSESILLVHTNAAILTRTTRTFITIYSEINVRLITVHVWNFTIES